MDVSGQHHNPASYLTIEERASEPV